MTSSYHEPVLVSEVFDALNVGPGKKYIDGTVGGGGHTREITKRGGIVLGIDTDSEAVEQNKGNEWKVVQGNFRNIKEIAKHEGFEHVDGILFDLGVSSHQLDTPKRGFSYRFVDAPLDLRMRQEGGVTAAQLVKESSEEELYEIFTTFGEEERARPIAHAIVSARSIKPIERVGDIVDLVGAQHASLSRIFQALRIAVNDELKALEEGIRGAYDLLKPGGILVVISFHSLEDRIVKRMMREKNWSIITRKPVIASEVEVYNNRRSRSAKMRVAQKI